MYKGVYKGMYFEQLGLKRISLDECGSVLENEVREGHCIPVTPECVQMLREPIGRPEPRGRVLQLRNLQFTLNTSKSMYFQQVEKIRDYVEQLYSYTYSIHQQSIHQRTVLCRTAYCILLHNIYLYRVYSIYIYIYIYSIYSAGNRKCKSRNL